MEKLVLLRYALTLVGVFIAIFLTTFIIRFPGMRLQKKFQSLGNMKGMDRTDIVKKCGNFSSIQHIDGGSVCVWAETGYVISLVFNSDNKLVRIGSETSV